MLNRLVGWSIFAQPDAVVRHHINHACLLQGREADRTACIIGEHQESAAIGNDAAVKRHPVHGRSHAELADAVINIAPGVIIGSHCFDATCLRIVRARQVSTAANRVRQTWVDFGERHLACLARRNLDRLSDQRGHILLHRVAMRQIARHTALEFSLVR